MTRTGMIVDFLSSRGRAEPKVGNGDWSQA
jgi:hypothetical protein